MVGRDYRPDDFERIVALDQECFEPGIAYSANEMKRFLRLSTREAVVVDREGDVIAFCIGYRSPARTGRILTIDVSAAARRSGIGRMLLEEVTGRLFRAGATETVLEVDVRNGGAVSFYESLGFRPTARVADYYGNGRDALEMVRRESAERSRAPGRLLAPDP